MKMKRKMLILKNGDSAKEKILIKIKSGLASSRFAFYINNNLNLNSAKQTNSII